MKTTPVLICGAGPVGLSLSLALSRLGINHLLIEKHPGTSVHPKARGVNVRTMELFRLWGVESAILAHELPEKARRYLWMESVQGGIIGEVNLDEAELNDSPTRSCLVTQDYVEQELLNALLPHANSTIAFSTQLTSIQQHDDVVECELFNKKTQTSEMIQCQYVVAADASKAAGYGLLILVSPGSEWRSCSRKIAPGRVVWPRGHAAVRPVVDRE